MWGGSQGLSEQFQTRGETRRRDLIEKFPSSFCGVEEKRRALDLGRILPRKIRCQPRPAMFAHLLTCLDRRQSCRRCGFDCGFHVFSLLTLVPFFPSL